MKHELIDILRCPKTGQPLSLNVEEEKNGHIFRGELITSDKASRYPIQNYIPRFVPLENYAKGFGFQWNKFRKTQLDSYTGVPLSRSRFYESSGWTPEMLKGKKVLDIGCGAGRFTEIALEAGAHVIALDYSTAVDACWANHGPHPNLNVIQGDIYSLPFLPGCFDFVYCLGVLQHTPDVKMSFMTLPKQLGDGGKLVVDVYPELLLNLFWPKYWMRPITKRIPQDKLFGIVEKMVSFLLPISLLIGRIPKLGRKLKYAIPVCNYESVFPLTNSQLKDWALLDTFDMLAPMYDQPQTLSTLKSWFEEVEMIDIEVFRRGANVGRGVKSNV